MDYFVVYRPGNPSTWHVSSAAGFYDVATTALEALMMIGADANRVDPGSDDLEFSVRWINTPDDFVSPRPDDLPEIETDDSEPIQ
jgi:hypothetical protein